MKRIFLVLFIISISSSAYSEWKGNFGLANIYYGDEASNRFGYERTIEVVGTSGLSWPDGRQAIITTIEVKQKGKKWLNRCIDYYDKDMRHTGEACSELSDVVVK